MRQHPPSWQAILRMLLDCYVEGSEKGKQMALFELGRMADAADQWNAFQAQRKATEKRIEEMKDG